MKPSFESAWNRLINSARLSQGGNDAQAPFGFSTRVASLAFARPGSLSTLAIFEGLSLRALWVAGMIAMVALAANYRSFTQLAEQDVGTGSSGMEISDPIAEILDATTQA